MQLVMDSDRIKWFEENNISFDNRFGERIKIGDVVHFSQETVVEPYSGFHAGYVLCKMGFMSFTNSPIPQDIVIGRYCSLGPGLSFPRYRHPIEHVSTSVFTHDTGTDLVIRAVRDLSPNYKNFYSNRQKGHITIEHDVWIGQGSAIMAGVTIGTGSIVAANSVVTKDVLPYTIVGGSPAKIIKHRFDPSIKKRLLESEWWKYKFTDFDGMDLSNPEEFLEQFEMQKRDIVPYEPGEILLANALPN